METKTLDQLQKGEILLLSARKVNGGKIQLEFAQHVELPNSNKSILGLLNKSDERFNASKARHAWLTAVAADASELFKIDFSELDSAEVGSVMELNVLNPTVAGQSISIEVRETTLPNAAEIADPTAYAKRAGTDGEFIVSEHGEFIYDRTTVVTGAPSHKVIQNTKRYNPNAVVSNNPLDAVI